MSVKDIAKRADELKSELEALDVVYPYEWDYFISELNELVEQLKQEPLTFTTNKP